MPRWKNSRNLPEPMCRSLEHYHDKHSRGRAWRSVTELIDSPLIFDLKLRHGETIEVDYASNIWLLVGQIGHEILSKFGGTCEVHVEREVLGKVIGGTADILDKTISDYKFTSFFTVKDGYRKEWECQLNTYNYLGGMKAERLEVIAIMRDWAKRFKAVEPFSVKNIEIPLWDEKTCLEYIRDRIKCHEAYLAEPFVCTLEERWAKPEKWAVYHYTKSGPRRANATKLFEDEDQAEKWAEEKGEKYEIEHRPAVNTRCDDYCDFRPVCPYMKDVVG